MNKPSLEKPLVAFLTEVNFQYICEEATDHVVWETESRGEGCDDREVGQGTGLQRVIGVLPRLFVEAQGELVACSERKGALGNGVPQHRLSACSLEQV